MSEYDRTRLRLTLTTYFSESEVRDLCFDLGVDYESLAGEGKRDMARELIARGQRCLVYSRIRDLEEALAKELE